MKQQTITQSTTRLLRAFVAALSIMMLTTFTAQADDTATSGTGWTMTGGTLTITKDFDAADFWAYDNGGLMSLVATLKLTDDVTEIADGAFQGCTVLETITWGTGLTTIGKNAFNSCTALTEVELPEGITTLGHMAFSNCGKLNTVTLPKSLTTIGNSIFNSCTALTTVTLTEGLTTTGGGSMFQGCTALTSITLPASLEAIGGATFNGCTALATVNFQDNSRLNTIKKNAFEGCTSLASLALPERLETIQGDAFKGCTSLTTLHIPASVTKLTNEGTTDITAFRGSSITTLKVAEGNTAFSATNNVLFNADGTTLMCYLPAGTAEKYTVPAGVTTLLANAFNDLPALKELTLPGGVTTMDMAINNCEALTTVTFLGTTPPSDIVRGFAFGGPATLATIYVPTSAVQAYKEALKPANLEGLVTAIPDLYLPDYATADGITLRHTTAGGWTFQTQANGVETPFSGTVTCLKENSPLTPFAKPLTIQSTEGEATLICDPVELNTPGATALTIESGNVRIAKGLIITAQTGIHVKNGATLSLPELKPTGGGFENLCQIIATGKATEVDEGGTLNRLAQFDFEGELTGNITTTFGANYTFPATDANVKSIAYNGGGEGGIEFSNSPTSSSPIIGKPAGSTTYTDTFKGAPATGMVRYEGLKKATMKEVTQGGETEVTEENTVVKGDDNTTAGNITLGTDNVFFDNVKTQTLTINSGVTFTLTDEIKKNLTVTINYVNDGGTFTDETGTVAKVVDGSGNAIVSYNPTAIKPITVTFPHSLSIHIDSKEGVTPSMTPQKKDNTGNWQTTTKTTALRATAYSIPITETGTYRVAIKVDNTTLYTPAFVVTEQSVSPTYYTVTLPQVEGATLSQNAGTHFVEEGYSFSFALTLNDGYKNSKPIVKANEMVITLREPDGLYTIANVYTDTNITIEGIVKDSPTGIGQPNDTEVKVYAIDHTLYIYTPKEEMVSIVLFNGVPLKTIRISGDARVTDLPQGAYIIKIGTRTFKVML